MVFTSHRALASTIAILALLYFDVTTSSLRITNVRHKLLRPSGALGSSGWDQSEDSYYRVRAKGTTRNLEFPTFGSLNRTGGLLAAIEAVAKRPFCLTAPDVQPVQRLVGLPSCLEVGARYLATLMAEDQHGRPRACGGDYFEILLYGGHQGPARPAVLKRPWLVDTGTGNYTLELHVPALPLLAGDYELKVHMLFQQGAGFGLGGMLSQSSTPARLQDSADDLLVSLHWGVQGSCGGVGSGEQGHGSTASRSDPSLAANPTVCHFTEMQDPAWRGHWLRAPPEYALQPCQPPFCAPHSAPILAVMDDNTDLWVYRREDCVFRLMHPRQARQCMHGKNVLGVGDSNMQDSLRNLMMHALQVDPGFFIPETPFVPPFSAPNLGRSFNFSTSFPGTVSPEPFGELPSFDLSLGLMFSGHYDVTFSGGEGVRTYVHPGWLKEAAAWWRHYDKPPDILFVNDAGLHTCQWAVGWGEPDGMAKVQNYTREHALPWLLKAHPLRSSPEEGGAFSASHQPPRLIFRNNIVPGHAFRGLNANPQSLEAINAITSNELLRALRDRKSSTFDISSAAIIDAYDMTFPFHYYDFYSDGGHYGRPIFYIPTGKNVPLFHFVDDMMVQAMLAAACS
jgi:hypothetical protein